jgi:hypothetical protein
VDKSEKQAMNKMFESALGAAVFIIVWAMIAVAAVMFAGFAFYVTGMFP